MSTNFTDNKTNGSPAVSNVSLILSRKDCIEISWKCDNPNNQPVYFSISQKYKDDSVILQNSPPKDFYAKTTFKSEKLLPNSDYLFNVLSWSKHGDSDDWQCNDVSDNAVVFKTKSNWNDKTTKPIYVMEPVEKKISKSVFVHEGA